MTAISLLVQMAAAMTAAAISAAAMTAAAISAAAMTAAAISAGVTVVETTAAWLTLGTTVLILGCSRPQCNSVFGNRNFINDD